MSESFLDQINRLRQSLTRFKEGTPSTEDLQLADPGNCDAALDVKLSVLQIAAMRNIAAAAENNHVQIALAMDFAKHVTFYAMKIRPDPAFWTTEINDDVEQMKFLFLRAQNDVETLVRQKDPAALAAAQRQKQLLDEFNLRNARRVSGQTLYDAIEKPGDLNPPQAREKLIDTRAMQLKIAAADVQGLIDRAVLSLKRLHFVQSVIKPLFATADDLAAASWDGDIAASRANAAKALDDAETALRYHAVRHSAFSNRLNDLKPV